MKMLRDNNSWLVSLGGKAYDTFLVLEWLEVYLSDSVPGLQ